MFKVNKLLMIHITRKVKGLISSKYKINKISCSDIQFHA